MTEVETGPVSGAAGFAVSPEAAEETFRRLSDIQDTVARMARRAMVLGRSVPLGGGYAEEIGVFMARYGVSDGDSAAESLTRFGRELEELKSRIEAGLRRYEEQDRDAAEGVDCVGGG